MTTKKVFLAVVITVFVICSFYFVYAAGSKNWPFKVKYQVVALESGEVYFGKLSLFPSAKMMDVWTPQQSGSEKKPSLQLVPFTSSYFSPENTLYLSKEKIIWWSDLKEDSQAVKIMTGKAEAETQTQGGTTTTTQPTTTTTK